MTSDYRTRRSNASFFPLWTAHSIASSSIARTARLCTGTTRRHTSPALSLNRCSIYLPGAGLSEPRESLEEHLHQLETNGHCRFSTIKERPDGTSVPLEVNARRLETEYGPMIFSVCRDVTEKVATEEALREMAFRDKLTGLANRTMLEDRLKLAISNAQRHHDTLGMLYIDLDDFKPINDTYGHSVGDEVLKVVAERMQDCMRTDDTIARVGGDEFVIVLPRLRNSSDIEVTAQKVHDAIS